ncbi:CBO0543 family protein [Salipaludibacillus sp. CF4.18]|uniref:CBO0543 family protein n=1 Tax=Salipaludibacillus sp. CF4.18 TaxID=3373081 RepID=UPI003EE62456
MSQQEHFEHIHRLMSELENTYMDYWQKFSDFRTWEFWAVLATLTIPIIILIIGIDKSKIFLLGFFGYSVHILAAYTDALGIRKLWWDYPHVVFPQLPGSISIDASLIPVYFIFLYQWCLNKNKNYWLYASLSAIGFTFILKPIMISLNLFQIYTNWFVLLAAYLFVIYGAKIITNIFITLSTSHTNYR